MNYLICVDNIENPDVYDELKFRLLSADFPIQIDIFIKILNKIIKTKKHFGSSIINGVIYWKNTNELIKSAKKIEDIKFILNTKIFVKNENINHKYELIHVIFKATINQLAYKNYYIYSLYQNINKYSSLEHIENDYQYNILKSREYFNELINDIAYERDCKTLQDLLLNNEIVE